MQPAALGSLPLEEPSSMVRCSWLAGRLALRTKPQRSALSVLSMPGYSGSPASTSWLPPPQNCREEEEEGGAAPSVGRRRRKFRWRSQGAALCGYPGGAGRPSSSSDRTARVAGAPSSAGRALARHGGLPTRRHREGPPAALEPLSTLQNVCSELHSLPGTAVGASGATPRTFWSPKPILVA